jgi:hypothetical protein
VSGTRTTVAFLDLAAGVAGDMCLGALVDAGLPLSALEEVVAALGLRDVTLRARRVRKGPLAATKVDVVLPSGVEHPHGHPHVHGAEEAHGADHGHRTLAEVLAVLRGARGLPPEGMADAVRAFTLLADAEARVHGVPPEEVRFHEVGAVDALVDVVGTCVGLRRLGVLEVRAGPLPWFSGRVRAAHGDLALPAPAVALLMQGHPTYPSGETFEQVTPTGAAIVRALSRGTEPPVGFVPRAVGLGAGDHPGGRLPNVVRLVVGETGGEATGSDAVLLETNLDDATGQEAGHALRAALAAGALDAWAVPVTMKKGRPGVVLCVLAAPADVPALEALLFRETPTLGVRRQAVSRTTIPRRLIAVSTPYGPVHVKVRTTPTGEDATPEYEDCRRVGERAGVPWRRVSEAARRSWEAPISDLRG